MAHPSDRVVIHRLIVACRDAERGFRAAAQQVHDAALRAQFTELADQRRHFAEQLLPHAYRLGDEATPEGSRAAALHRAWMHLRSRLASDQDRAIVAEAERGERFAVAAYDHAVHDLLLPDTRELVAVQDADIRDAHRSWRRRCSRP